MSIQSPHVVIVGAGFGGLEAARRLADAPVRVTLLDTTNFHLFQPLLYQVATSGLAAEDIAYPVREILRSQRNLEFRMAHVSHADLERRLLYTDTGEITYDYLILAIGGETNYMGIKGVEAHGNGLKNIMDAIQVRNHILNQFELAAQEPDRDKRRQLLTFTVAGGGATGVESAGALSELIHLVLVKDYRELDFSEVRILLVEASDRLLPALTPRLSQITRDTLASKHVEVLFSAAVSSYDGETLLLRDGTAIPTKTLIWAAGIRAASLAASLPVAKGSQGRLVVTPTLQLGEYPEVFVIGDAAYLEGPNGRPLPMVAPVAYQEGKTAADNIKKLINGQELTHFVYSDPGSLATIGRNAAVGLFKGREFRGFVAWFLWMSVHVMRLVGFRNRLLVLINWAWDYFFFERAVRLITGRSCTFNPLPPPVPPAREPNPGDGKPPTPAAPAHPGAASQ